MYIPWLILFIILSVHVYFFLLAKKDVDRAHKKQVQKAKHTPAFRKIQIEFASGLPFHVISQKTRKREIADSRHIAMWFLRRNTNWSTAKIGRFFGSFDHSTVIHACSKVDNLRTSNLQFAKQVEKFIHNASHYEAITD